MALPELNNRGVVRSYFEEFERRFVAVGDDVIYQRVEGGDGVRMPATDAAELIAGMRATLFEVDAANPLWGGQSVLVAVGAVFAVLVFGFLFDFGLSSASLVIPTLIVVLLCGPGLGHLRAEAAWRRGLAAVEARVASFERVPMATTRGDAPPNPVRPIFITVTLMFAAVAIGLMTAATGMTAYERFKLDRLISQAVWPMVAIIVGLALTSYAFDAFRRRRVSEAEIAAAMARRSDRPLG